MEQESSSQIESPTPTEHRGQAGHISEGQRQQHQQCNDGRTSTQTVGQSGNDTCIPEENPNDASHILTAEQILGNLHFLAMFEQCQSLRLSLGESDIGRRLLSSLDLWLKLGRPDPVFGRIHGPRHEWVPRFESWIQAWALEYSDFPNER